MTSKHVKDAKKIFSSITWIFKYKFEDEKYLIKYKTRWYAKDDLQSTEQDIYTAILIYKIFRALMMMINVWDLKTRQWNAINAFANSNIDQL